MKKIGLLFSLLLFSQQTFSAEGGGSKEETLVEKPAESIEAVGVNSLNMLGWMKKCRLLPKNVTDESRNDFARLRSESRRFTGVSSLSIEHSAFGADRAHATQAFTVPLDECMALMTQQLQDDCWKGKKYSEGFAPFAQKLDLPENAKVFVHGDFHGDVHSFVNELMWLHKLNYLDDNFKIKKHNVSMVFLGDYVDRGNHGAEVIYTLLRLKLANPDRVFMARGNHEDLFEQKKYGFFEECNTKFSAEFSEKIAKIYDLMPVVLYVGCGDNYLQCCHGGMEPGYNPKKLLNSVKNLQLLGELKRSKCSCESVKGSAKLYEDYTPKALLDRGRALGFAWNDFCLEKQSESEVSEGTRGLMHNEGAVKDIFSKQNRDATKKVRGVFRAHQHATSSEDFMMQQLIKSKGVYKLWNPCETNLFPSPRPIESGLVWTFNVAPDTPYGAACNFTFDAFGILTVNSDYEKWGLQVVNTDIDETFIDTDSLIENDFLVAKLNVKKNTDARTRLIEAGVAAAGFLGALYLTKLKKQ